MRGRKIVCLGGGSGYFSHVLCDLVVNQDLAGSEITLYDIDQEKAQIMAGFARKWAKRARTGFKIRACRTLAEAVDGADFAISSIGGAGPSAGGVYGTYAHSQDILVPAKYGIYQIVGDTCGPAGMMMGLRSIPAYLGFCREMERRAPDAIIFNHSNPMAVLCRAMNKYAKLRQVVGICHGVQGGLRHVAEIMGIPAQEIDAIWIGTNHYYWFTRLFHRGRDIYPEFRKKVAAKPPKPGQGMCAKLSKICGFQLTYPDDGHAIEFYPFLAQVKDEASIPYVDREHIEHLYSRLQRPGAPVLTPDERRAARRKYLAEFRQWLGTRKLPKEPSDPIVGEGLSQLIGNIVAGRRRVHIVNIPNRGAIPNLPDHALVEIDGVTDSCGLRGLHMGEAPAVLAGMLQKRFAWQELVVDAGVHGDRNLALQALLLDEMAIRPELAEKMLDELLEGSRDWLPQFFGRRGSSR